MQQRKVKAMCALLAVQGTQVAEARERDCNDHDPPDQHHNPATSSDFVDDTSVGSRMLARQDVGQRVDAPMAEASGPTIETKEECLVEDTKRQSVPAFS